MIKLVLAMIIGSIGLTCNAEAPSENDCDVPFDVSSVLKKLTCDAASTVVIFNETDHQDPTVVNVKSHAMYQAAETEQMYTFIEGQPRNQIKGHLYGLENPRLLAFAEMNETNAVASGLIPADDFLKDYVKSLFSHAILSWPDIWVSLRKNGKITATSSNREFVLLIDQSIHRYQVSSKGGQAWQSLYPLIDSLTTRLTDLKLVRGIAAAWLLEAKPAILNDPELSSYLVARELDDVDGMLVSARSILFVKTVLDRYCEAAKTREVIWLSIGMRHASQTQCLLQKFLPPGANIRQEFPNTYSASFSDWFKQFQAEGGGQAELTGLLQMNYTKIVSVQAPAADYPYLGHIQISKNLESDQQKAIIDTMSSYGAGYGIVVDRANSRIVVSPKLGMD